MFAPIIAAAILLHPVLQKPPSEPGGTTAPGPSTDEFQPGPSWKKLGKDLWFDPSAKTVILRTRVCLREGYLEHLLCAKNTKEHESILVTEAPPRLIHAAILLTGAEVGTPVQFVPDFKPPEGTPIAIEALWNDPEGHPQRIDARRWVKREDSEETLAPHWVFAGSSLFPHPETGKMIYAADSGDLITVSNFMSAILDVPFASSADDSARSFMAFTDRIPPVGTAVTLLLSNAKADPKPPRTKAKEENIAPLP